MVIVLTVFAGLSQASAQTADLDKSRSELIAALEKLKSFQVQGKKKLSKKAREVWNEEFSKVQAEIIEKAEELKSAMKGRKSPILHRCGYRHLCPSSSQRSEGDLGNLVNILLLMVAF